MFVPHRICRRLCAWLIFDVGPKQMSIVRHFVMPSFLAGGVFAAPYAMLVGGFLVLVSGAPNDPPRTWSSIVWSSFFAGLVLALLMSVLPATFFCIARHAWPSRDAVVREHLFGWPIGIALVAAVSVCTALMRGPLTVSSEWIALVTALLVICGAGFGVLAALVWRRLSYRT